MKLADFGLARLFEKENEGFVCSFFCLFVCLLFMSYTKLAV